MNSWLNNLFFFSLFRGRPPSEEAETAKVKKPAAYTGSGYRLGSEDEPSTIEQPASPVAPPTAEEDNEPVCSANFKFYTFYVYSCGFE